MIQPHFSTSQPRLGPDAWSRRKSYRARKFWRRFVLRTLVFLLVFVGAFYALAWALSVAPTMQ